MSRVFRTTEEMTTWIEELRPPKRPACVHHMFDRDAQHAHEGKVDEASALLDRAERVAESARKLKGEHSMLVAVLEAEVTRLRVQAKALRGYHERQIGC